MKYFIFLMSIWAIFAGRVFSQNFDMIRFLDCGEEGVIQSLMPVEGKDFFAIKNPSGSASPFGEVRFTPDGSPHWHFHWQYEGVNQSVVYEGDSTYMTVALKGNGVYAFRAEKEGTAAIEATFIVFYDYLDFAVSIPMRWIVSIYNWIWLTGVCPLTVLIREPSKCCIRYSGTEKNGS